MGMEWQVSKGSRGGAVGYTMKQILTAVVAFFLGAAISALVYDMERRAEETARRSAVDWPTAAILVNINEDLRAGRQELAHRKMMELEEKYLAFRDGGLTPEAFMGDVTGVREKEPVNQ
jgi:hypothetical protein